MNEVWELSFSAAQTISGPLTPNTITLFATVSPSPFITKFDFYYVKDVFKPA